MLLRVDTRTLWKNEVSKASDYNITPISRSPAGDRRGLLVVFLIASRRLWFKPMVRHFLLLKVAIAYL